MVVIVLQVIIGHNTSTLSHLFIDKLSLNFATLIINNCVRVSWIATTHQEAKTSSEREEKHNNYNRNVCNVHLGSLRVKRDHS